MGVLKLKIGPSLKLKIGPSFFIVFPHFYSVFGVFLITQIDCAKIVFLQNFGDVKNEVFKKKIAFFCFCLFYVGEIETEKGKNKQKWKRPKTP